MSRFFNWSMVFAIGFFVVGVQGLLAAQEGDSTVIRLASTPALSPDGKRLAFSWRGDLWIADATGGVATRLTDAPGVDQMPAFSPDGKQLAFVSQRTGVNQVFLIAISGGPAQQITFHSEGCKVEEWTPGGRLLVNAQRDHFWRDADRLFEIEAKPRPFEKWLFDAAAEHGRMSADENRIAFTREGTQWWRKGYRGSQAAQLWTFDRATQEFKQPIADEGGVLYPLWSPDGKTLYFVAQTSGVFQLCKLDEVGTRTNLTDFADDSVVMPCISRDGSRIVFRHLFDLYSIDLATGGKATKLEFRTAGDYFAPDRNRSILNDAQEVAFSDDGLEIAFVTGGDLWVMDTELREPVQVTNTPEQESSPLFGPDNKSLLFTSDSLDQSDIWMATRRDETKYWWQNEAFDLKRLTEDSETEAGLALSPTKDHIAFVKGNGQLWIMSPDGQNSRRLINSWNLASFDWSPDGKWITYAQQDDEFNSDIWVMPIDGSRAAVNLSTHPDNDTSPVWSPDGKIIAFTGRRVGEESDVYFVYLTNQDDEATERDRKIKEALEKMEKGRKAAPPKADKPNDPASADDPPKPKEAEAKTAGAQPDETKKTDDTKDPAKEPQKVEVKIDFDGISDRIRQVAVPNSAEVSLFWSPDSKKLAFTAAVDGKRGLYTISLPSELKPTLVSPTVGSNPRWLSKGDQIVWLVNGVPGNLTNNGTKATAFSFSAKHEYGIAAKFSTAFDLCWREMRDSFYDGNLNNRNWNEIRRKYKPLAVSAHDVATFSEVVNLMLGELNGSHLGFFAGGRGGPPAPVNETDWKDVTAHFGLRFDSAFNGPGWKVRDVIYNSPAWQQRSRIEPGEIVVAVNGNEVDPAMECSTILNGPLDRNMILKVKNAAGEIREVTLRPISYAAARGLLYEHWIRQNQAMVTQASNGTLGYMHIQGMSMPSFYRFERELYQVGAGKDGIVIDVRENGGGSTADHLLTMLTQPVHAVTVPRGGGPGYPQDRKIYASWNKPIVVMCNQNSFSNAEIFSHAIKSLNRGHLVGVPTAGGVISTGGTAIMDLGFLRKPFRGWYISGTGQDMELNGAVPDHIIWPTPTEWPSGQDRQLVKAIEVLLQDVAAEKAKPKPPLIPASQRPKN